jgi:hypothetical protein
MRVENPVILENRFYSFKAEGGKLNIPLITILVIGIITLLGGAAVFGCGINGLIQPAYLTWVGLGSLIFGTLFTSYLLFDLPRLCSSSKKRFALKNFFKHYQKTRTGTSNTNC